ncbi:hypothetical protein BC829DRAFT_78779 [Chytridium lagenaria]|nr:hypothetical protein BC829DRAFT_78779 [Chytridium lagenaria]
MHLFNNTGGNFFGAVENLKAESSPLIDLFMTPPMESPFQSFASPSTPSIASLGLGIDSAASVPKLNLTPDQATALLASAEANIHLMFPELVPTVERLRASLRATQPAAAPSSAMPSPPSSLGGSPVGSINVAWEGSPMPSTPLVPGLNYGDPQPSKPKVGRKRKVRSMDPVELLAELDQKRQRNTEAARRSRIRKMAEQEVVQNTLSELMEFKASADERFKAMEKELSEMKSKLSIANAKLAGAGLPLVCSQVLLHFTS